MSGVGRMEFDELKELMFKPREFRKVPSTLDLLKQRKQQLEELGCTEKAAQVELLIEYWEKRFKGQLTEEETKSIIDKILRVDVKPKDYKFDVRYIRETNEENMKKLLNDDVELVVDKIIKDKIAKGLIK